MAIVAGGIVTLKPIGGIVTNNPNVDGTAMTPEQLQVLQQQRQQEKQHKADTAKDLFTHQTGLMHQSAESEKQIAAQPKKPKGGSEE